MVTAMDFQEEKVEHYCLMGRVLVCESDKLLERVVNLVKVVRKGLLEEVIFELSPESVSRRNISEKRAQLKYYFFQKAFPDHLN